MTGRNSFILNSILYGRKQSIAASLRPLEFIPLCPAIAGSGRIDEIKARTVRSGELDSGEATKFQNAQALCPMPLTLRAEGRALRETLLGPEIVAVFSKLLSKGG
jgi:hypothetical protein